MFLLKLILLVIPPLFRSRTRSILLVLKPPLGHRLPTVCVYSTHTGALVDNIAV